MHKGTKSVIAAIDYIEDHLCEKLDLEAVADAVHYSKYHLHRMFTGTVGLTVHDYVQRRRLTVKANPAGRKPCGVCICLRGRTVAFIWAYKLLKPARMRIC